MSPFFFPASSTFFGRWGTTVGRIGAVNLPDGLKSLYEILSKQARPVCEARAYTLPSENFRLTGCIVQLFTKYNKA